MHTLQRACLRFVEKPLLSLTAVVGDQECVGAVGSTLVEMMNTTESMVKSRRRAEERLCRTICHKAHVQVLGDLSDAACAPC